MQSTGLRGLLGQEIQSRGVEGRKGFLDRMVTGQPSRMGRYPSTGSQVDCVLCEEHMSLSSCSCCICICLIEYSYQVFDFVFIFCLIMPSRSIYLVDDVGGVACVCAASSFCLLLCGFVLVHTCVGLWLLIRRT